MTRLSSRTSWFAAALLSALGVASQVHAKPPDLPVDPNETIPVLAPLPEPLPGWPTITINSAPCGVWTLSGNAEIFGSPEDSKTTTLTIYPGENGVIAVIDPDPMPQPITIYHPVRPNVPLSVQRTIDKCLLFGTHPLLSLLPLPVEPQEIHVREVIQAEKITGCPAKCPAVCDCHVPAIADADFSRTVEQNLASLLVADRVGALVGSVVFNNIMPAQCLRVELRTPTPPPVEAALVTELEKLFDLESNHAPQLKEKSILSADDWLQFIPGETWTEYDAKTNQARFLWRVRVGNSTCRLSFNAGSLAFDVSLTAPAAGGNEDAEEPKSTQTDGGTR